MPGGSGTNFNGDAPPRAREIPWAHIMNYYGRALDERKISVYEFGSRRVFPDPALPGIYDPSTDQTP